MWDNHLNPTKKIESYCGVHVLAVSRFNLDCIWYLSCEDKVSYFLI